MFIQWTQFLQDVSLNLTILFVAAKE